MTHDPLNLISDRAKALDVSGIRRAFQLGATLKDPINLSIGQPDFAVPQPLCDAAIEAIQNGRNGYTLTAGADDLLDAVRSHLHTDVGWTPDQDDTDVIITSGTSGALLLACMALCDPGSEIVIPDPWFVVYPALGSMTGATIVPCETYDDFRMTAERVEPLLTNRTRIVLINSPANPTGVVSTDQEMQDLADLCRDRGVMLLSDEIYDLFTFHAGCNHHGQCPSPARFTNDMLLIRGFGKTYGCTGWRMGYAAGPKWLIDEMAKFQQYSFVCAPSMAQAAMVAAFDVDMSHIVEQYERRCHMVCDILSPVTSVSHSCGAFYSFVEVPPALGLTGTQFCDRLIERNVVTIPGGVFSSRDTHFRISFACDDQKLEEGLQIIRQSMQPATA